MNGVTGGGRPPVMPMLAFSVRCIFQPLQYYYANDSLQFPFLAF